MPHLPTLLLQIGIILIVARAVGWLFRRIHQPQVIGEMVAGILLGPSLLGWAWPQASATLFPLESLGFLNALSQVGLLLFMFQVGVKLDPHILLSKKRAAIITSQVSIAIPFLLGVLVAFYFYPRLSDTRVAFTHFALFLGIAMSITAFPVLARILTERNLMQSKVGAMAIACAAVDDVTAWCILAGIVLLVRAAGSPASPWLMLLSLAVYLVFMLLVARRALRKLEAIFRARSEITQDLLALILLLVLLSSWITEEIGIHAIFGAFLIGALMPKDPRFGKAIAEKLEDVTVVLFLPLFFAFTGLRTSIGLLNSGEMWFYCGIVILIATAGKFGGATLSARATGMSWREAGALGIMMNTRGLMELAVLNIGLDIGVISPALFTIMVIMALVTTLITSPLLEWIYPMRLQRQEQAEMNQGEQYELLTTR